MNTSFNEKLIAYLTLISGLSISAVAVYYSVVGLTTIFAAAVTPIIIMGVTLEVSKLIATVWLKQNWTIAPRPIKIYLLIAIAILMFITSMGIFGLLSKAHSDQSLVSGDILAKLAVYDEKIKTAKENIEADRRQLKQMDEAVDQVMARSTTEQGADKSVAIRKAQARDRSALAKNIEANQKLIATLNDESATIRAEVRKVEAEVGPLKYIASFIYGESDKTVLEKAVTWVIILIVLVFDPLAVILLLASQISFQNFKIAQHMPAANIEERININDVITTESIINTDNEIKTENKDLTPMSEHKETIVESEHKTNDFDISKHPYLFKIPEIRHPPGVTPVGPQVYKSEMTNKIESPIDRIEELVSNIETSVTKLSETSVSGMFDWSSVPPNSEYVNINGEQMSIKVALEKYPLNASYVQNEEQQESGLWSNTRKT